LARIVLMSSDDPFLGTGTTAIAANCNRGSEALPREAVALSNLILPEEHPPT